MSSGKRRLAAGLAVTALAAWLVWDNLRIQTSSYTLTSPAVPEAFSGFRIVQISDLHNRAFGRDNEPLLQTIAQARPDLLVLTGDLVDSRHTDVEVALAFVKEAARIAPVYYVSGNHEVRLPQSPALLERLRQAGATVLENEKVTLQRQGQSLTILGLEDPSGWVQLGKGSTNAQVQTRLEELRQPEDGYTVLLCHRPELFPVYAQQGIHLVFAGHAHGGQVRLPLLGGLVAPNQGFFPAFDAGTFTQGSTTMVVSRGLGNSLLPVRFCNPAELVVVEISCP